MQNNFIYDSEQIIKKYLPNMIGYFGLKNHQWQKLDGKLTNKINDIHKKMELYKDNCVITRNLLFMITYIETYASDVSEADINRLNVYKSCLKYLDGVLLDLHNLLPSNLTKRFINKIIWELLIDFPENNNINYINRLSEIFLLHFFLMKKDDITNSKYFELLEIESKIREIYATNGYQSLSLNHKEIDFCFILKNTNQRLYVEVNNINNIDPIDYKDEIAIENFLKRVIKTKESDKFPEIDSDTVRFDLFYKKINIHYAHIINVEIANIKPYLHIFDRLTKDQIKFDFYTHVNFYDSQNNISVYTFDKISKILLS